jgi:two-component system chemotaxis response regulator CheY
MYALMVVKSASRNKISPSSANGASGDPFFRILCVEDDPTMLQMLALGFRRYGFEVITASHGLDAIKQFHAHAGNFAAVLTENNMPKMDGVGFVRFIRALDFKGRVLVMSGCWSISDCRAYQEYKVSGFLSKPFEISTVAAMLLQD